MTPTLPHTIGPKAAGSVPLGSSEARRRSRRLLLSRCRDAVVAFCDLSVVGRVAAFF